MSDVCLIVCLITFGYTLWLQFCFCLVSLRGGLRVAFWALIGSCIYVTFQIKPHSLPPTQPGAECWQPRDLGRGCGPR